MRLRHGQRDQTRQRLADGTRVALLRRRALVAAGSKTEPGEGDMAKPIRMLVAGESWVTRTVHTKGYDSFETSSYGEGGTWMLAALRKGGIEVTYQPSHIALNAFPASVEALSEFDVVALSDIGSNTLL